MPIVDSPEFGHTFVPIDSLTSSPRSSTVSTSVLEWNSNSGSEGFSVRSLDHEQYVQSSSATPDIPNFSPNPPSQTTSLPDDDQTFASFNSAAAPVADSVTDTVTSDTFAYHNLLSALDERLTLQDSVAQWQNHSYRETAGLDNRPESPPDLLDDGVLDKPHMSSAPSPNRSLATESLVSAVTAKPSLHVSSLFLPPSPPAMALPAPPVYSASPSMVSNQTQSGSISIAQYFQLKAANVEEAVPVQPHVDRLIRPISAASCLSYTSSVQTPVDVPLPDSSVESPLLTTWQDLISRVDKSSNSTTAYSPPMRPPRCSSGYTSWYQPLSRPRTSENNNAGSQFNPFICSKFIPPSSQGSDTLDSNLKSHSPFRPAWPIPPAIPCQFGPDALKPIKPVINPRPNIILDRPQPCAKVTCGPLHGKIPGKSTSHPVPPSSRDQSSPIPFITWQSDLSRPSPWGWSNEHRVRDIGQASPESIDSVLPPPRSTPSVSSPRTPTRPGSPRSPISAIPPSPSRVELQPPYLRHPTPSNAPYIPLTPPAPPVNGVYTQRTSRALPIPSMSRTCGTHSQVPPYTPRYTDSTLPRDMHLSAAPPTPWGPTPRRLRFAPLPPTPSAGLHYTSAPPPVSTQSYTGPLYTAPLPPYPLYPMPYPLPAHAPAPQTPAPISTPYSSWRPAPINSSPLWTPHHVFWYSDGSIVFRIENIGYKVHRHFFERHSTYFRDLLAYPTYSVTSPLPHTIYLSDVKKVDFERLLLIFYPSSLAADGPELFTVEEWTSILTLSDKWNFAELKTQATFQLSSIMSTIEKIALSKKYNVGNPYWLLAAYRELCTRRYPLSIVEGEKLGLETVIKIWEVQHELLMGSTWGRSVDIVIKEKFGLL